MNKAKQIIEDLPKEVFNNIYDVITNIAGSNNKINSIFFQ